MHWPNIFVNVITPIVFVIIGILANRLGRRDGDGTPFVNYFAVGTSVFIMSLASILSDVHIGKHGALEGHFAWIAFYVLFVFVSIDVDRYSSWERNDEGRPTDKKHMLRGVIFPNFFGVVAFCLYKFMA